MRRLWLGFALVLAFLGVNFASAQLPPSSGPSLHVMSFCPSGCDSTATTFVVPPGVSGLNATFCGSGGPGGGGYAGTANSGAGGGASGSCYVGWPIAAQSGVTLTLNYAAGPTGAAIGATGKSGTASYITWTQGAFAFSTPQAFGGSAGILGGVAVGGNGGNVLATVNNDASNPTGSAASIGTGGTGGTSASGATPAALGTPLVSGPFAAGIPGAGGGAAAGAYAGGNTRIFYQTTAGGTVSGGPAGNTNTCGGGGAAGSSLFALGGAGGTYGTNSGNGANAAGNAAGGGGAACNGAGGNGGDEIIVLAWYQ